MNPPAARRPGAASAPAGPTLSQEMVVDRAVKIADAEGLEAVTVRRVAQELGVTPMALYWHVSSKDDLLAAMGDRLYADLAIEVDPTTPWQDQLRQLADALLLAVVAHPRLAPLAGARVLGNDNGRRLTETALSLLESAGFSVPESAVISRRILHTILTMVTEQENLGAGLVPQEREAMVRDKQAALAALPPGAYPHLVAAIDDLTSCDDEDAYYSYSLDLLLAGIEQLASRTPA